ncbi:hypothetical protein QLQ12_43965 [Actinoplanes sp. NEAU-A12]|uniref:Uncharacterized protein n=1 Tax=Actinoplanes sandaracinus TaxID=3045177 RepID=A0ABT6X137_9ACTN|nr:hypothetical protein [Actinoplanes sandaracinus]MDI6105561.1 hypothetical protein [Actinoplanes sandaracinus]
MADEETYGESSNWPFESKLGNAAAVGMVVPLGATAAPVAIARGLYTAARGRGFEAGWEAHFEWCGERIVAAGEWIDEHPEEAKENLKKAGKEVISWIGPIVLGRWFGGKK